MNHLTASWQRLAQDATWSQQVAKTAMADTLEDMIPALEKMLEAEQATRVYRRTVDLISSGKVGQQFTNRLAAWGYLRKVVPQEIPGFDPEWIEVMGAYSTATAMVGWSAQDSKAIFFLREDALNEIVLLHEVAHLILQYRGESDGHGDRFQQVCSGLYRKRLGFALFGRRTSGASGGLPEGLRFTYEQGWEGKIPASLGQAQLAKFEHAVVGRAWSQKAAALVTKEYEGTPGNPDHVTCDQRGTLATSLIADMPGARDEIPGDHRNMRGEVWESFKADIKANGITDPIFITVDYDIGPRISEGNHRRDAAVELGLTDVPVQIRYFGKAETLHRVAGKSGDLPKALRFTYDEPQGRPGRVIAWDDDTTSAWHQQFGIGMLSWDPKGQISWVQVYDPYQRRGIASAMLIQARRHDPRVHHSTEQSADAKAWTQKVAYQGGHQPPDDGDLLHDLGQHSFPSDVYDHPEWYVHGGGASYDRESIKVVRSVRDKPEAMVTIYRAAPEGVTTIEAGNWVALAKAYCQQHAMHPDDPSQDMPVYAATVPARTVRSGGNDLIEWGYWGNQVPCQVVR